MNKEEREVLILAQRARLPRGESVAATQICSVVGGPHSHGHANVLTAWAARPNKAKPRVPFTLKAMWEILVLYNGIGSDPVYSCIFVR